MLERSPTTEICKLRKRPPRDTTFDFPKFYLKPCPFCGNDDMLHGSCGDGFEVQCIKFINGEVSGCGARVKMHFPDEYPPGIESFAALQALIYEEVARKWNRRVGDVPLPNYKA